MEDLIYYFVNKTKLVYKMKHRENFGLLPFRISAPEKQ